MFKKLNAKKKISIIVIFICLFIIIYFGLNFLLPQVNNNISNQEEVSFNSLDNLSKDRINFLLLGTDGSNLRTDTILFVSFDKINQKINMVSIPRDTRVLIKDKFYKINACVAYGKEELLFKTVREITGAPINYYAKINFDGFKNVIDILGGVDFNVPVNMKYSDPEQNLYINLKQGQQHLDGAKAIQLVRYRGYAEADLQRVRVQQDFIKAVIKQKMMPEYILKASSIYSEITKYVKTNFTVGDLLGNMSLIKIFQEQKEGTINNFTLPGTAMMINGASYYIHDSKAAMELFKENFGGSGTSDMDSKYTELNSKAKPDSIEISTKNNKISDFEDEIDPNDPLEADSTDKGYRDESVSNGLANNETDINLQKNQDISNSEGPSQEKESIDHSIPPDWLR